MFQPQLRATSSPGLGFRLYSGRTEHFWGGPSPILMKLSGMVSYMEKMIKKPSGNCFGH